MRLVAKLARQFCNSQSKNGVGWPGAKNWGAPSSWLVENWERIAREIWIMHWGKAGENFIGARESSTTKNLWKAGENAGPNLAGIGPNLGHVDLPKFGCLSPKLVHFRPKSFEFKNSLDHAVSQEQFMIGFLQLSEINMKLCSSTRIDSRNN